ASMPVQCEEPRQRNTDTGRRRRIVDRSQVNLAMSFENQLALVTGASRGIGAATAIALAAKGAHVILTARTAKDLEEVEEKIHNAGGKATIAPLDLTDGDSIGRLAQAISGRWDALDRKSTRLNSSHV